MRSFYMVRHGETTTNLEKIATGQMNVELTRIGKQQAEQCRNVIKSIGLKPDVILCSGLNRTIHTADIINQVLGCNVYIRPELDEQNYGDWEGKRWDIILPEIEKDGENPPNGESQSEFYARINSAIEELFDVFGGTILFVAHAGVFKCMFTKYGYPQATIENGVLYEFKFSTSGDELLDVQSIRN